MNLWDKSLGYTVFRIYVDACIRSSYSTIEISGHGNIPDDGAVLFAANHTNTLMDALVILQDNRGPISFGARADIFKNPKIARILNWLKILPLARQRDGMSALAGNSEVFDRIVECISHGAPFCLYPEGTHRTMHSLQPLKKGIFRIAIQAVRETGQKVYIVPVGIDYEDFFHYACGVRMKYGTPILVNQVLEAHPEEAVAMHLMTEDLYDRMSALIRFVPNNTDDYDKNWRAYLKRHHTKPRSKLSEWLMACVSLPIFLVSAVLSSLIVIPSEILVGRLKDKAWSNTVRFGVKLVLLPLLLIVAMVISILTLPWYLIILVAILTIYAQPLFYRYLNLCRNLVNLKK